MIFCFKKVCLFLKIKLPGGGGGGGGPPSKFFLKWIKKEQLKKENYKDQWAIKINKKRV